MTIPLANPSAKSPTSEASSAGDARRLALLPPTLVCGIVVVLGIAATQFIAGVGSEVANQISAIGGLSLAIAMISLLPFATPVASPLQAGVRYFASMAIRFAAVALAGVVLCVYLEWPLASTAIALVTWAVVLLAVEVVFIARLVARLGNPPKAASAAPLEVR